MTADSPPLESLLWRGINRALMVVCRLMTTLERDEPDPVRRWALLKASIHYQVEGAVRDE